LVVRECCNTSGRFTGTGDLFLEDVCSNPSSDWRFGKQNVWARQLDVEYEGLHVENAGGKLWILGFKTERGGTLVHSRDGGSTEILGGLCYTTTDPKGVPMFMVENASLAATFGETCFTGKPYEVIARRKASGVSEDVKRGETPSRAGGSLVPRLQVVK
jgi:hypothetical protein